MSTQNLCYLRDLITVLRFVYIDKAVYFLLIKKHSQYLKVNLKAKFKLFQKN